MGFPENVGEAGFKEGTFFGNMLIRYPRKCESGVQRRCWAKEEDMFIMSTWVVFGAVGGWYLQGGSERGQRRCLSGAGGKGSRRGASEADEGAKWRKCSRRREG